MNVSLGLALVAGTASILLPCVFSILPVYVGYLGGRSITVSDNNGRKKSILSALSHGLVFFAGFGVIFIFLVSGPLTLVSPIFVVRPWLPKLLGVMVAIFGLQMAGVLRIPFLAHGLQPRSKNDHFLAYLSSALIGILFSAGWVSCTGRVLGNILTLMMDGGAALRVFQLLLSYTTGIAVPFLLAAAGIGWVQFLLKRNRKWDDTLRIAMGILLTAVGAMLFLGIYDVFARMSPFIDLGL